jgi:hypothetical protein
MDVMFSNRFFKKKYFLVQLIQEVLPALALILPRNVLESALEPAPDFMRTPLRWYEQRSALN